MLSDSFLLSLPTRKKDVAEHRKELAMNLYPQQQKALDAITIFLDQPNQSIFILRGYAGTGKTTMIRAILPLLEERHESGILMAPTGRAAKVLSEKTGQPASTIHRVIYEYTKMLAVHHDKDGNLVPEDGEKGKDGDGDDLQFWFQLRKSDEGNPSGRVFIVDESSMISSKCNSDETLHFGTDNLLEDLLTYAQLNSGGKIIFIGDPAQLPPVGDNCSAALSSQYFTEKNIGVATFELTDVIRQDEGSTILKDAMMLRDLLNSTMRNELVFERKQGEVMDISPSDAVEEFCKISPSPAIGETVIVCYSNSLVKTYNDAIRNQYFPTSKDVVAGDILQVVRNNVNSQLELELYNGDFVRVLSVSDQIETQSAPVWTDVNGTRARVTIELNFRDVTLQTDEGEQVKCKIIDSLLHSRSRSLTNVETIALYINFRMRHPGLRKNEDAFRNALMADPYFNAVQVKYGYAITAHKSQGGEWNNVFVDYSGRHGLNDDCLRWMYTATTRAKKQLYGINIPNITPLSKLKFNSIVKLSKPSKEAFSFSEELTSELLPETANAFQKSKCVSAKENLQTKGFVLSKVETLQYVDRYTIETPDSSVVVDCQYNGSGVYTRYRVLKESAYAEQIIQALSDESNIEYTYHYEPSSKPLAELNSKVLSVCDDLGIRITNVVEHPNQYYVVYYLKTSGKFSQVMFYYKANGSISNGVPSSDKGDEDALLQQLIDDLS